MTPIIRTGNAQLFKLYCQVISRLIHISTAVGLQRTRLTLASHKQFDLIGPGLNLKQAQWVLSSERSVSSVDIRDHLDWLLARVTPQAASLTALQAHMGVQMLLDCVLFFNGGDMFRLRPDQLAAIGELNLPLSFDFYFLWRPESSEDEEEEESG